MYGFVSLLDSYESIHRRTSMHREREYIRVKLYYGRLHKFVVTIEFVLN